MGVRKRTGSWPSTVVFGHKVGGHSGGARVLCRDESGTVGRIWAGAGCGVAELAFLQTGVSGNLQVLLPSNAGGGEFQQAETGHRSGLL